MVMDTSKARVLVEHDTTSEREIVFREDFLRYYAGKGWHLVEEIQQVRPPLYGNVNLKDSSVCELKEALSLAQKDRDKPPMSYGMTRGEILATAQRTIDAVMRELRSRKGTK
jgi:hypothetical protein